MWFVNMLTVLALISGNYLAVKFFFDHRLVVLFNLSIVIVYISARIAVGSGQRQLYKLRKDHSRLNLIYESERRDIEILHILDEISEAFMEDKNVDSVFKHTLDGILQVLKGDISTIEIITDKDSFLPSAKMVRGAKELKLNENIYEKVLLRGSSILINSLSPKHSEYNKYKSLYEEGIQSLLIAPLKIEGKSIGLVGIFSKEGYDFTGEELRLLSTFATHASLIIENARLLEATRKLSLTDELTKLHNPRYFRGRFPDEFSRAKRYNHNLSFLMCDIDYFKNYNDTNGHEAGNEVLRRVAGIMSSSVRDVDFVARYGGEEFVILLIETSKKGAGIFAERLREKIEKEDFPFKEKQPKGELTVTIGIASFPEDANTPEELLNHADDACYKGKEAGRNRVVEYG